MFPRRNMDSRTLLDRPAHATADPKGIVQKFHNGNSWMERAAIWRCATHVSLCKRKNRAAQRYAMCKRRERIRASSSKEKRNTVEGEAGRDRDTHRRRERERERERAASTKGENTVARTLKASAVGNATASPKIPFPVLPHPDAFYNSNTEYENGRHRQR